MKIFAAGISTETNTFSPLPTGLEDFNVQRGKDALAGRVDYPSLDLSRTWGAQAEARGDNFVFSLMAWAQPSGLTTTAAYETLRDEILGDLRAAQSVDVVLLNLHGAMVAQGYEDCEADLIRRARDIVGSKVIIGVVFDLHCHLSEAKIAPANIVLTYKEYPHTDINDRARELFDLTISARLGKIHPTTALFDCRMVGSYPTTREPLRGFVEAMKEAERRRDVLSVSFGHGFRLADLPHVGAKVLVVTDSNRALAQEVALEFGMRVHALRRQIGFDALSLPMEKALTKALSSHGTPVVVADQSDNPGSGAPGDATFTLQWLLDHKVKDAALAIVYDPQVVRIASKAGIGAVLPVRLGGKLSPASGVPVDIEVMVKMMRNDYLHEWPQRCGPPLLCQAGDVVALRDGNSDIDVIVSSQRCQCFSPSIFSDLGIDPKTKRLLILKSTQHFYEAFAPLGGEVIYMAAPGAAPPDPRQIPYRRLDTSRLYPWVDAPLA